MRLIKIAGYAGKQRLSLMNFVGDVPNYAILSHTWGSEEVSFAEFSDDAAAHKRGYRKIRLAAKQAARDKLQYLWVDTCCIDKSSSAELSEAINSMFRWYQESTICYAYLDDIEISSGDLSAAKWHTRGWTLQELIAPTIVRFYDVAWNYLGDKVSLSAKISHRSGVPSDVLHWQPTVGVVSPFGREYFHRSHNTQYIASRYCVAQRMSWAASRETTRVEDRAYCLLGLFDVNMPLLYGEGPKAFMRLQEEIMKTTDDQSVLAWGPRCLLNDFIPRIGDVRVHENRPFLATSPDGFRKAGDILLTYSPHNQSMQTITNDGLLITLPILTMSTANKVAYPQLHFALLACTVPAGDCYIGLPIDEGSSSLAKSESQVRAHKLLSVQRQSVVNGNISDTVFETVVIPREVAAAATPRKFILNEFSLEKSLGPRRHHQIKPKRYDLLEHILVDWSNLSAFGYAEPRGSKCRTASDPHLLPVDASLRRYTLSDTHSYFRLADFQPGRGGDDSDHLSAESACRDIHLPQVCLVLHFQGVSSRWGEARTAYPPLIV